MKRSGVQFCCIESNREEDEWDQQNRTVQGQLSSDVTYACKQVRVDVPEKKHELEKENARGPDIRGAAEVGEKHLADHRLAHEEEKSAEKEGEGEGCDPHGVWGRKYEE